MNRLHNLWLKAQGVPDVYIHERAWRNPFRFQVIPHHCVVCGRPWRPDKAQYVAVTGYTYPFPIKLGGGLRWRCDELGIRGVHTGVVGPSTRHICTEHSTKWSYVVDCVTGESVQMHPLPSTVERICTDVCYWTGSGMRLVFILAQQLWRWARFKVTGRLSPTIRAPWPPLRKREWEDAFSFVPVEDLL